MSDSRTTKSVDTAPVQECEPVEDHRAHDFKGWVTFDEGRGGTTVCTRCGMTAFAHALRYAP